MSENNWETEHWYLVTDKLKANKFCMYLTKESNWSTYLTPIIYHDFNQFTIISPMHMKQLKEKG